MPGRNAYAPFWPATVVLWGAGATAQLGFPTTDAQASCLSKLAATGTGGLEGRVRSAFPKASRQEQRDIEDFLLILGDADGMKGRARQKEDIAEALRRQFDQIDTVARQRRKEKLQRIYDWPTLRRVILSSPRQFVPGTPSKIVSVKNAAISLQDLFNLLDLHIQANIGFHAPDPNGDEESAFIPPDALPTARRALQLLIILQFAVSYRQLLDDANLLRPYQQFAEALARLMQKEGRLFATQGVGTKTRNYYLFGYSLVSMNWDPLLIWLVFNAHNEANHRWPVVSVGRPSRPQKLFNDLAYLVVREVESKDLDIWYMMNESTAQRLNDPKHSGDRYVRTGKFYFPHGSFNLRECPNCGKMNAYLGNEWNLASPSLLPPLPIPGSSTVWSVARSKEEEKFQSRGDMDALQCVYCGSMMGFEQISLLMQTNFKGTMSPYLDETQRELRAALENAKHIVLMGYSLPKDDVFYRSVLAARLGNRPQGSEKPLYISLVNYQDKAPSRWLEGQEIVGALPPDCDLVRIYRDLSSIVAAGDPKRVRVRAYGRGVPDVFAPGGGPVDDDSICDLLFPWGLWQEHFEFTA
jgi:hypothetical protein